ncbi:MAG TPA: hypothetical protein VF146_15015 [Bryobacteraceae bacterium]
MNDGFQMYLEEHGNKLGGLDVKFRAGRRPGKAGPRRDQGKKLVLNDNRLSTRTGKHRTQNYIPSIPAADDLTQRQADKYPYLIRTGWSSSQPGLQENLHDRLRL